MPGGTLFRSYGAPPLGKLGCYNDVAPLALAGQ